MKYLVHLTSTIDSTLRSDDLRGEPRWERNVIDALLSAGREVHTVWPGRWRSPEPKPDNFHDGINSEWLSDSMLISYGSTNDIMTHYGIAIPDPGAKCYLIQYYDGPNKNTKNSFLDYHWRRPGSIVAMCNYKSGHYMDRLCRTLGPENVEWIQGPAVPQVYDNADNFNEKILLWSYRNLFSFIEEHGDQMFSLCEKIASFLSRDENLRLVLTIGAFDANKLSNPKEEGRKWLFEKPFMNILSKYSSRIEVVSRLHWYEILDLFSKTKIVISPPAPYGLCPHEAAMYGIPVILLSEANPFIDDNKNKFFPELLVANSGVSSTFLELSEKMFSDHSFYRSHGDAYRRYVKNNSTYEAFLRQVDDVAKRRGWG